MTKIEAIKYVREKAGTGLHAAKEIVERLAPQLDGVPDARTLRDEYAMAALTGILANKTWPAFDSDHVKKAFQWADAMMEARK